MNSLRPDMSTGAPLERLLGILATAFAYALALFVLVRWEPDYMQTASGDDAFTYTFHYLFAHGATYGRDVTTTAGAWSLLHYRHYYPPTYLVFIAGQTVIALAIAATLLGVTRRMGTTIGICFFLGTLALLSISPDARFFYMGLMALLIMPDFRQRPASIAHLGLVAFAALACLIKSTFLLVGAVIAIVVFAAEAAYARRLPITTISFLAFLFLFNALAGQTPASLVEFLAATSSISSGYAERFSELGSPIELAAFLAVATCFGIVILVMETRRMGVWGLLPTFGYAAILFALFKTGFVRQDGEHAIRAFCAILPFTISYFAVNSTLLVPRSRMFAPAGTMETLRSAKITLPIVAVLLLAAGYFAAAYPSLYMGKLGRLAKQVSALTDLAASGQQRFLLRHEAAVTGVAVSHPLPQLSGSVSVFSVLQTPVIAQRLAFLSLPTSVPYLASTPQAESTNEKFLSGEGAPDHVLFGHDYAIGASGLALLRHYLPSGFTSSFLILDRGSTGAVELVPAGQKRAGWNDPIDVPVTGTDAIRARIRYQPTALTRLMAFLYQPPPVYMVLRSGSHVVFRVRLNRSLTEEGLLVSPALNSRAAFAALSLSGDAHLQQTTTLQLEIGEPASWLFRPDSVLRYFQPEIDVAFDRLSMKAGDTWLESPFAPLKRLLDAGSGNAGTRFIDLESGKPALGFSPEGMLKLAAAANIRRIRLSFGILDPETPVLFQVRDASGKEIWSKRVDAAGPQAAEVDINGAADRTERIFQLTATRVKPAEIVEDSVLAYLDDIYLER